MKPIAEITVTFSLTVRPRQLFKHLKNERGLGLFSAGDGITYIEGDILPVQILESKRLPEDENLFIKGLQRGKNVDEVAKILKEYDNLIGLDMRNVYIDRFIQANKDAFKEVVGMSEGLKKIWDEVAEEAGWFAEREQAAAATTAREIAKQLLKFGDPVEKIAAVTKLPVDEIMELA